MSDKDGGSNTKKYLIIGAIIFIIFIFFIIFVHFFTNKEDHSFQCGEKWTEIFSS